MNATDIQEVHTLPLTVFPLHDPYHQLLYHEGKPRNVTESETKCDLFLHTTNGVCTFIMCFGRGIIGINSVLEMHSGFLHTLTGFQGVYFFMHRRPFFPTSKTQLDWKKKMRHTSFKFLNCSATESRSKDGMS